MKIRQIKQSDMLRCPYAIMMMEHYREDGTCRCNDPDHTEMQEWGYTWDGQAWSAPADEDEDEDE